MTRRSARKRPKKSRIRTTSDRVASASFPLVEPKYRLAEERPERPREVEVAPLAPLLLPNPELPVEGQQATEQVEIAAAIQDAPRQIHDGVVLPVAVLVEVAVGVVEEHGLRVGVHQARFLTDNLVEGGGVLEGETAPAEFRAPLPPRLPGRTQVSLIHKHQVVASKLADGDPFDSLLLGQLVHVGRSRPAGRDPRTRRA